MMDMCLAVPAKIMKINGEVADVDFGEGILREVNITLVEPRVGEYVLVHAGYAITVVDKEEAEETLRLWGEILRMQEPNT
jgi:hydrogenase expression/formation protein HypC